MRWPGTCLWLAHVLDGFLGIHLHHYHSSTACQHNSYSKLGTCIAAQLAHLRRFVTEDPVAGCKEAISSVVQYRSWTRRDVNVFMVSLLLPFLWSCCRHCMNPLLMRMTGGNFILLYQAVMPWWCFSWQHNNCYRILVDECWGYCRRQKNLWHACPYDTLRNFQYTAVGAGTKKESM